MLGRRLWSVLVVIAAGVAATPSAGADALSAVAVLREGGCGGLVPIVPPLRHDLALDRSASQWAAGNPLPAAVAEQGFRPQFTTGLHLSAPEDALLQRLKDANCRTVTDRTLRAVGMYRRAPDTWLVFAYADVPLRAQMRSESAYEPRVSAPEPSAPNTQARFAERALQLVNEARAHGVRCGGRTFAPARPVALSGGLDAVALGHAADMAVNNYFEHQDLSGHSPADRVRAAGYRERLVGENIAYGPQSIDEAISGWLASPGHCENIMDPRFAEMGIASASGQQQRHGLYWVQVLAEPTT
jgi:uncharacterized protein YkwD